MTCPECEKLKNYIKGELSMKRPLWKQKSFWTAMAIIATLAAPQLVPALTPDNVIRIVAGLGALEALFLGERLIK